jgi:hypothetical protein
MFAAPSFSNLCCAAPARPKPATNYLSLAAPVARACSGGTNWATNFIVTVTFLPLLQGAGLAAAYGLYAIAAALSCLFAYVAVRETKGKTLEEMSPRHDITG